MATRPSMITSDVECTGWSPTAAVVPRPPLEDGQLLEEIELLLDVIATVADYPNHLTPQQVDAVLHLSLRSL